MIFCSVLDEGRAKALESIRTRGVQHSERLNDALEQRTALLERAVDRDAMRAAEETLARGNADLARQAQQELAVLVAGASLEFRQAFTRARQLLGESWPLGEALSLTEADEERLTA